MQHQEEIAPRRRALVVALSVLGYLVVAAAILAEATLLALLIKHKGAPHGESRGFEGMAIIYVIFMSLWVVVPGTLIAFGRGISELARWRQRHAPWSLAFHLIAFVLPFAVFIYMLGVG